MFSMTMLRDARKLTFKPNLIRRGINSWKNVNGSRERRNQVTIDRTTKKETSGSALSKQSVGTLVMI